MSHELLVHQALRGCPAVMGFREVCKGHGRKRAMVLELAREDLMAFMLRAREPCGEAVARTIFKGCCQAVQRLHSAGFMHCDIKLENFVHTATAGAEFPCEDDIRLIDLECATWI